MTVSSATHIAGTKDFDLLMIPPLVERHVGDAVFYWQQHDKSTHSPLMTLRDLKHFDRLLDANLDGIVVAGNLGWQIALEALKRWRGPGEMFVCTYVLLASEEPSVAERLDDITKILLADPHRLIRGMVGALLWGAIEKSASFVDQFGDSCSSPVLQVVGWRAIARAPELLDSSRLSRVEWRARFQGLLHHADPSLRAAACRSAHVFEAQNLLETLLQDGNDSVAAEAAIACLQMNVGEKLANVRVLWISCWKLSDQLSSLKGIFKNRSEHRLARWIRHLALAVPLGQKDISRLLEILPSRLALSFVLHHGDANYLRWVVSQFGKPESARLAGWVWSSMTGYDLEQNGLVLPDLEKDGGASSVTDELDPGLPMPALQSIVAFGTKPDSDVALFWATGPSHETLGQILWDAPQALRWIAIQRASVATLKPIALSIKSSFWKQQSEMVRQWPQALSVLN
ncbi:hypothetical protein G7047_24285 [Diaphorobacter sp. HDW4A]|uniref:hypothetical protein n=1 Tax=Diaphorobacter sp. HDW4A TaxID=2714924 RepID=UPI00140CC472|nr:hypothetical protein [Diaphorobacter sp. HDW4A]QIL82705.1 hypothetical protein G7047_24285 [Diaphorobacter sp. HDW4A]